MFSVSVNDLIEYTDWERQKWHDWFRQHGDSVLAISAGPHGDGRLQTVGELVRHIFSAEKRYADRLSGRPLTETASLPTGDIEALFRFSQQSRRELNEFVATYPAEAWDTPQEMKIMTYSLTTTPKKIVTHILMHEIRHWAQIGTLLRLNGLKGDFHDFLFSPVMGSECRREAGKA